MPITSNAPPLRLRLAPAAYSATVDRSCPTRRPPLLALRLLRNQGRVVGRGAIAGGRQFILRVAVPR